MNDYSVCNLLSGFAFSTNAIDRITAFQCIHLLLATSIDVQQSFVLNIFSKMILSKTIDRITTINY